MNLLYITPEKWEKRMGWALFIPAMVVVPMAIPGGIIALGLYFLAMALATGFVFRRFLVESARSVHYSPVPFLWKTVVVYIFAQVSVVLINDLFFFFGIGSFGFGASGPVYCSAYDRAMALLLEEKGPAMGIMIAILIPFVWEVLLRGLFFNTLYHKSPTLAFVATALIFTLLHSLPYLQGNLWDDVLLVLQYLPASFLLSWAYTSTESLFSPMLIHMAMKIGLVSFLFDYFAIS